MYHINKLFETIKTNTSFHIFFLCSLGLFFRLYKFRQGEIIISSDEIYLYEYSLKPVYGLLSGNFSVFLTELFRFFNFAWGWGTISWSTFFALLFTFFKIPLTEVTMNFPYVIVGILSILAAYFVAKELKDARYAFIVALLLALLPSHIAYSRSIGVNGIVGLLFFLLTLLFFILWQKKQQKKHILLTYTFVGLYFVSDNQAVGIVPLLFFISYVYNKENLEGNIVRRISQVITKCGSWNALLCLFLILLPTITGAMYLWAKGLIKNSYLNIFHSKPLLFNFYFRETFATLAQNAGIILALVLTIGTFCYGALLLKKIVSKESTIIFLWLIIYATPWLFLVPPTAVDVRVYNTPVLCAMIFLTSYVFIIVIDKIGQIGKKWLKILAYVLLGFFVFFVIITTLLVIAKSVYNLDIPFDTPLQKFGAVGGNNGIKTIGWYVRENTKKEEVIFVDVESFTATYYFDRHVVGSLDLTAKQALDLFEKTNISNISYVFIEAKNKEIFENTLQEHGFLAIITAVKDEEIKSILYAKEVAKEGDKEISLDIREYDPLFDKEYGTIEELFIDFE